MQTQIENWEAYYTEPEKTEDRMARLQEFLNWRRGMRRTFTFRWKEQDYMIDAEPSKYYPHNYLWTAYKLTENGPVTLETNTRAKERKFPKAVGLIALGFCVGLNDNK